MATLRRPNGQIVQAQDECLDCATLHARNEALETFVQRVIDDEELCVGSIVVSDYEAKYGLGSAAQLLGPLARALLGQDKAMGD